MSKIVTFTADMVPTATQLDSLVPIYARKTADETVNNSATLQNDDHLSWAVAASCVYELEVHVAYSSGTTPDAKIAWTYPTGLTMVVTGIIGYDAAGTLVSNGNFAETTVLQLGGTGADAHYSIWAIVTVSSTAGTLQLQWAQNTANASNTVFRAGSYGRLIRIA